MSEVRTRFAPSPTGLLHIGGVRTALYAWLLAKHHGGKFLLRIEDTDQERLVPGAIRFIIEELSWFGVTFDEGPSGEDLKKVGEHWEGAPAGGGPFGPYIQSLRLPRYQEVANLLIEKGFAYRCDCTPEMLERERLEQQARRELPGYSGFCRTRDVSPDSRHVVRFKMPAKRSVSVADAIKGRIAWDTIPLRDPVILKSDGFPTYHLAVVVDDHDMKISHVMRGDEWIPSTPLHLLLYEALEWTPPIFAHLPVVLGGDGKKLSKRHGATSSSVLREEGYLADALFNFVVLVGWSPGEGEEQEVFSKEELIRRFSLDHVNKSSAVFDYNKLSWMNGVYIRNLSDEAFLKAAEPFLEAKGLTGRTGMLAKIASLVKERVKTLTEVPPMVEFLYKDELDRETKGMFKQGIDKAKALEILNESLRRLEPTAGFEVAEIEPILRGLADELGLKPGAMFSVLRIAVMGKGVTPPLFESFSALGKETTLTRMRETIALLNTEASVNG